MNLSGMKADSQTVSVATNKKSNRLCMIKKDLVIDGIGTEVMHYCIYLPTDRFEITILAGGEADEKYLKRYKDLGVKIIRCPSKDTDAIGYYKAIYQYLKDKPQDIVHIHGNSAVCIVDLIIAKVCGVRARVLHSHNTLGMHPVMHRILRPFCSFLCSQRIACSNEAGKWMFGNSEYTVIKNGIEVGRYAYSEIVRYQVRRELGINDKFVVGHIGRFMEQKNHDFLLDIFEKIHNKNPDALLLMAGDGPLIGQMREKAAKKGIAENTIFLGARHDTERLYQAMDVFCLPSLFEGLPFVLIEAQAAGLDCYISDVISEETDITSLIHRISLQDAPETWAEKILQSRNARRMPHTEELIAAGYDIRDAAEELTGIYDKLMKERIEGT